MNAPERSTTALEQLLREGPFSVMAFDNIEVGELSPDAMILAADGETVIAMGMHHYAATGIVEALNSLLEARQARH